MISTCEICKKPFESKKLSLFCSPSCWGVLWRLRNPNPNKRNYTFFEAQDGEVFTEISSEYPKYKISNRGRISKTIGAGRVIIKKLSTKREGYAGVALWNGKKNTTFLVHRLVAKAFIPNPNNLPIVNHKDGNKLNNNIENLEWCTSKENAVHYINNNINKIKGEGSALSVLTNQQAKEIRIKKPKGYTLKALALEYGVAKKTIFNIVSNRTYQVPEAMPTKSDLTLLTQNILIKQPNTQFATRSIRGSLF